jgi:hypothetical protein
MAEMSLRVLGSDSWLIGYSRMDPNLTRFCHVDPRKDEVMGWSAVFNSDVAG